MDEPQHLPFSEAKCCLPNPNFRDLRALVDLRNGRDIEQADPDVCDDNRVAVYPDITLICIIVICLGCHDVDKRSQGDISGAHGGRLLGRCTVQDTEEDTDGALACDKVSSVTVEHGILGHPQKLQNQSYTQLLHAQSQVHAGLVR